MGGCGGWPEVIACSLGGSDTRSASWSPCCLAATTARRVWFDRDHRAPPETGPVQGPAPSLRGVGGRGPFSADDLAHELRGLRGRLADAHAGGLEGLLLG